MLDIHYQEKDHGVFTAEIAEMKTTLVNTYAKDNDHPLLCTLEGIRIHFVSLNGGAYAQSRIRAQSGHRLCQSKGQPA